jgi:hypothetical protein
MIHDGEVQGLPLIAYRDTKANIEALGGVSLGAFAYATDVEMVGQRGEWSWVWYSPVSQVLLVSNGGLTRYDPSDAGLTAALAAASSGDTVLCPTGTFTAGLTVPAGVTLSGQSIHRTVLTGQVTLDGDGAAIERLSVTRSSGYGVVGPDSGTGYIHECHISSAGYGVSVNGRNGNLEVYGGYVFGTAADAHEN